MVFLCPHAQDRMKQVDQVKQTGDAGEAARLALSLFRDMQERDISHAEYEQMVAVLNGKGVLQAASQ